MDPFLSWLTEKPIKRRIFDALCANPYGLTVDELAWIVWGGIHEPNNSRASVWVHIVQLRHTMSIHLPILTVSSLRRSGRRYLLVLRRPGP